MKASTKLCLAAALLLVIVAPFTLVITLSRSHQSTPVHKAAINNTQINKQLTPPQPSQTLSAGGKPVPASSAARAKSAGYYCPSWDAAPGTIASAICYPLDK